jgi:gamma-glutamyltranspeptidase/glutathione hydrolase
VIRGIAAVASQPGATAAATAVLEAGGSAADAVLAGFFAAAGTDPGVLLAPAVALVAGAGAGARAFDGRAAQPGLGAARPRGFLDEASIPQAARVAAPRSIPMLHLLHTYRGRASLSTLAKHGVLAAEAQGAKARAALIRRVGASGVLALRSPEAVRALLAVGGAVVGGVLTQQDLEESRPAEADAEAHTIAEGATVFTPPWAPPEGSHAQAEVILACDGRGLLAALAYVPARQGIAVPELEILLRADAVPVRRGVTRVTPGSPLAAPAPVAIFHQKACWSIVGLAGSMRVDPTKLAELAGGAPAERALAELIDPGASRAPIALISDGKSARVVALG